MPLPSVYRCRPALLLLLLLWLDDIIVLLLHPQDAVRALLPGQLEAQPELVDQLGAMVSPRSLKQHGVTVYGVTQVRG